MNLSIIIPAYNEEKRIEKTLREYAGFFGDDEIYVIINGCKDNTLGVVKKVAKDYGNIRYANFEEKIGKGGAIIEGFKLANKEFIGFVDADLCTPPEAFKELIDNINGYDGIIASRYVKGSKILVRQPLMRRISSGAKLFKKNAIKRVANEIKEKRWAFDVELLYLMKKKGFKVREYATVWKEPGHSRLNLKKIGPEMFTSLIKLRIRNFINN